MPRPRPPRTAPTLCSRAWSAERGGGRYGRSSPPAIPTARRTRIEEAVQYACKSFLDEAEGITAPGQVYAWIRTAAHRSLGREADLHHRELVVDPVEDGLEGISAEDAGPAEELIALEDDADLSMLVEEVASSLRIAGATFLPSTAPATSARRSPNASA